MEDLTPREKQVITLLLKGYTNKEIGMELGITANSVKKYLQIIYQKLGVRTRLEAALLILKEGLLEE